MTAPELNKAERIMHELAGIRISLCQMSIAPGKPDRNTQYIIQEIRAAAQRGVDIIAFPEMATTGYLIADAFEDSYFMEDVMTCVRAIVAATPSGITAIFGTPILVPDRNGEDGRPRKHNTAIVASGGNMRGRFFGGSVKTLQPNYRFFNDAKHMLSMRGVAEEIAEDARKSGRKIPTIHELLTPVSVAARTKTVPLGVILCEDMWHNDYALNPAKMLVENGAKLIINLSSSPWTWQKNRKRHAVVKNLLQECQVPLCYVNNTGAQNVGKNIIVFDGSSAIYNAQGEMVLEIPPYQYGSHDFTCGEPPRLLPPGDDTTELYQALVAATAAIAPSDGPILVGLSGGIDSAVVAAHLTHALGPDRVVAVNMPFLNSPETQAMAETIARNLGIRYEVRPIKEIVEATCRATGITLGTLAYENVQARARKEILAGLAQEIGGRFICCSNKVEMAFGYGTLYGDIAGFYAPLGDLVKREVRQIADYLNRVIFRRTVIPVACINQRPTAELKADQFDPFDYGDLHRRGYHDEMVRAYTEFRKNPEWFLELYHTGKLEPELRLDPGTLEKLFPTPADFITDLEHWWKKYYGSYFKRIQCPPIPVVSKRAFGRDLEESLLPEHFTGRYHDLKTRVLRVGKKKRRIAIFGGALNPPGIHHWHIVKRLTEVFDLVVVTPCGVRKEKSDTAKVSPADRKTLVEQGFDDIPGIAFDFFDLDHHVFTPTYALAERYQNRFADAELWFVVGGDLVEGGGEGNSEVQREWIRGEEIWETLNFAVIHGPGYSVGTKDLPPHSAVIHFDKDAGRSTMIRTLVADGKDISYLVLPGVARYIAEHHLYR